MEIGRFVTLGAFVSDGKGTLVRQIQVTRRGMVTEEVFVPAFLSNDNTLILNPSDDLVLKTTPEEQAQLLKDLQIDVYTLLNALGNG